jgi:hypothetical protein
MPRLEPADSCERAFDAQLPGVIVFMDQVNFGSEVMLRDPPDKSLDVLDLMFGPMMPDSYLRIETQVR